MLRLNLETLTHMYASSARLAVGIIRASLQLLHQLSRLPRCPFILRHAIPRRVASLILKSQKKMKMKMSCKTVSDTSHLRRGREGRRRQNGRIRGRAHGPEPERRCASSVLCVSSPFACPVFGLCMKAAHLPCQHVLIATASLQPTQPEPKGRGCARGSRGKLASASLAAKRR